MFKLNDFYKKTKWRLVEIVFTKSSVQLNYGYFEFGFYISNRIMFDINDFLVKKQCTQTL